MDSTRIPMIDPAALTDAQRPVYDAIVSGPRGTLVGPLRAALHSPELASRWQHLGEFLRFGTTLPKRASELAILVTGRRWNSQVEFLIHGRAAAAAGLPAPVIEAIRLGQPPAFDDPADAAAYEYARQLQGDGQVTDAAYAAVRVLWGTVGIVELTAVIGYYTMVSMTLNAHEIPLPENESPPLSPVAGPGLTALPAARTAR